jgi:hypothetical protein
MRRQRRRVGEMRQSAGPQSVGQQFSGVRGRAWWSGVASLDYVLILGSLLPLCGILLYMGRRIILLAYEMVGVAVSSPFF